MPSLAGAAPAAARAPVLDTQGMRLLGLALLLVFTLFVQLDAISNRLSGGLPVSPIEISLGGVVAVTLLLLAARLPVATPPRATGSTGIRLMSLMMLWAVVAWTLSAHLSEGLSYLVKLGTAIVPALCLCVIADRPAHLRAVLWTMILASTVSAAIVLIEAKTHTRLVATALAATTADFDGVARSSGGSDQNPTTAAQMLMTGACLAIGLFFAGERRGHLLYPLAIALGAAGLALMSARSAILGLGAAAGLVVLSFRHKRYFPLILGAALAAGAVTILFAPPTLIARFAAIADFGQDQTLYRRITYLRIGADLVQQSPIWGIGPGNFPEYYVGDAYRYMPGRILTPRELHNSYLDAAVEYGLTGFAIFMALLGHAVWSARRGLAARSADLRQVSFAVVVALAALLVACFFMPHKNMRYLWLLVALAIQCGRLRSGEARRP